MSSPEVMAAIVNLPGGKASVHSPLGKWIVTLGRDCGHTLSQAGHDRDSRSPVMTATTSISGRPRRLVWLAVALLAIGVRIPAAAQPPTDRTKLLHTLTGL